MFKGPAADINLHVFSSGCPEINRILNFRDWLRSNAEDELLYIPRPVNPLIASANWTSLTMPARVKNFFVFFCSLFSFFGHTTPFTPKSGLIGSVNSASTTKARL
jgi:hypothetical protein